MNKTFEAYGALNIRSLWAFLKDMDESYHVHSSSNFIIENNVEKCPGNEC